MRVLVAGASGDVGREVVRALLERGDDVIALSRSPERAASVTALGARHVAASALEAEAVGRAVAEAEPEGVVDVMTALPRNGPMRASDLAATNRLRRVGSANLVAASRAAGVERLVGESIAFVYGYRTDAEITEDDPPAREEDVTPSYRPAIAAALEKESMVTAAGGTALRFGVFYGPSVGSTRFMVRMLRRGLMALPGGGRGVVPWIHVEDAAAAVIAALDDDDAGGRVLNVVDDEPATWSDVLGELADRLGTRRPRTVPMWLASLAMPYAAEFIGRSRLVVSNGRARAELGWKPEYPTFREGMAHVAAMASEQARGRTSGR